jgi:hypothetical protein
MGLGLISCDDPGLPEPVSYPGTWVGYLGYQGIQVENASMLIINSDRTTTFMSDHTGNTPAWGDYRLVIEGTLTIRSDDTILGEVTITRYRAGVDTLQNTAIMSGAFELRLAQVLGEWYTPSATPFGINGSWGARKQE